MTDPTHSPRPETLAAARRSSLAAIGQPQLADGRTVPPQRAVKEEAKAIRAQLAAVAVRTTSPDQQNSGEAR